MAGLVVYARIPEPELRSAADDVVKQITNWFEQNPKRRVCRTELWYGRYHSIKRKDVQKQIAAIVEDALK